MMGLLCFFANVGLPTISINLPSLMLLLFVVIALESKILARYTGRSFRELLRPVSLANLLSTFVGLPALWLLLAFFDHMGLQTPYFGFKTIWRQILTMSGMFISIPPWRDVTIKHYHVSFAATSLHVIFFFASYFIESWFLVRYLRGEEKNKIKKGIWIGNIASYSVLIPFTALLIYLGMNHFTGLYDFAFAFLGPLLAILCFSLLFILGALIRFLFLWWRGRASVPSIQTKT